MATDSLQSSVIFPCECEHKAHTERALTPNGKEGHRYLAPFAYAKLTSVATPYGTMVVCGDCSTDCLVMFPRASS